MMTINGHVVLNEQDVIDRYDELMAISKRPIVVSCESSYPIKEFPDMWAKEIFDKKDRTIKPKYDAEYTKNAIKLDIPLTFNMDRSENNAFTPHHNILS